MGFFELELIAIGLSMDAFACAIAKGVTQKRFLLSHAIIIGVFFGGFQGLMPLLGWLLGAQFADLIEPIDHWIAFGLLVAIGAKMLWDGYQESREDKTDSQDSPDLQSTDKLDYKELFLLAIATSIDALAVGVGFAFLDVQIGFAAIIIGITTFIFSVAGVAIGRFFGSWFEKYAAYIGGIVLICIGFKTLFEHLGLF